MPDKTSRGTLDPKIPSKDLCQALELTAQAMFALDKQVMTPEQVLSTCVTSDRVAANLVLRELLANRGRDWASFAKQVESEARERTAVDVRFDWVSSANRRIAFSDEMLVVMDEALSMARAQDEVYVGTDHVLIGMLHRRVAVSRLLDRYGVTLRAVQDRITQRVVARGTTTVDYVALARQGETMPVYFRDILLRDLTNLLTLATDRHVILMGPDGVGKRTLVYSLAQLIADGKGPQAVRSVVEINEEALLDNALLAVQAGLRRAKGGVLCVPHLGRFFGGYRAEVPETAGKEILKAYFDSDVVVVGTATESEYVERLQSNPTINGRAHVLRVNPATTEETECILEVIRPRMEADYGLQIDTASLRETARLAGRYLAATPLPASAVHLLHRTCATVKMSISSSAPSGTPIDQLVDVEDVTLTVSQLTSIPVSKLGVEERTRYAHMVEFLSERIIGQDEAVLAVSRAVKTARVGLKDPKRPIGSFFFLGPTGVGKTELAKALTEFLFGHENAMIVLDMTEYQDENAVSRLIGAPPGYVGFEEGGQLTEKVSATPYSVVLFDEVEKAHVRVLDVLLQIMEEGRLTDGKGRTVSFSEAVVILTSNIGGQYLVDPTLSAPAAREMAETELHSHFRPEFLNRLTDIVLFDQLDESDLRKILGLLIKQEAKLAQSQGLNLDVSDGVRDWLMKQNDHPEWGARPLRRILERHIREPLADWLLTTSPAKGTSIRVRMHGGRPAFSTSTEK